MQIHVSFRQRNRCFRKGITGSGRIVAMAAVCCGICALSGCRSYCVSDIECGQGFRCVDGRCSASCLSSHDCGGGSCVDGVCVSSSSGGYSSSGGGGGGTPTDGISLPQSDGTYVFQLESGAQLLRQVTFSSGDPSALAADVSAAVTSRRVNVDVGGLGTVSVDTTTLRGPVYLNSLGWVVALAGEQVQLSTSMYAVFVMLINDGIADTWSFAFAVENLCGETGSAQPLDVVTPLDDDDSMWVFCADGDGGHSLRKVSWNQSFGDIMGQSSTTTIRYPDQLSTGVQQANNWRAFNVYTGQDRWMFYDGSSGVFRECTGQAGSCDDGSGAFADMPGSGMFQGGTVYTESTALFVRGSELYELQFGESASQAQLRGSIDTSFILSGRAVHAVGQWVISTVNDAPADWGIIAYDAEAPATTVMLADPSDDSTNDREPLLVFTTP